MSNEKIDPTDEEDGAVRPIARLLVTAERELCAFIAAVNELFDAREARQAAENWMAELAWTDWAGENPITVWRRVTIVAATGLARGVNGRRSRNP